MTWSKVMLGAAIIILISGCARTQPRPGESLLKGGVLSVARWQGDKKAAFSIFSDDGEIRSIKSDWTWGKPDVPYDGFYKLGKQYRIPVSFMVMPEYISAQPNDYRSVKKAASWRFSVSSWADWQFLHQAGHEVSSHTWTHGDFRPDSIRLNLKDGIIRHPGDTNLEFIKPIAEITKYIGETPITINIPYGNTDPIYYPIARHYYPILIRDCRADTANVAGVGYSSKATLEKMAPRLDSALQRGKWLIAGGHGIRTERGRQEEARYNIPPDSLVEWKLRKIARLDGSSPVEYAVLDGFFALVDKNRDDIFIGTIRDVGRYLYERKAVAVTVKEDTKKRAVISLAHSLDPRVFNYPLTLKLKAKKSRRPPEITQAGVPLKSFVFLDTVLFDAVPNGGDIVIRY